MDIISKDFSGYDQRLMQCAAGYTILVGDLGLRERDYNPSSPWAIGYWVDFASAYEVFLERAKR
jgi:hypothetical protein